MSIAPASLTALSSYWQSMGGVPLGIVGDARHAYGYHCGRDRIYSAAGRGDADYSVKLPRDKAGLTNAAAAIDLGKLNGTLANLQKFSSWLAAQCMAGAPGSSDVREIIFSPDGTKIVGWSCLAPKELIPNYGDNTHAYHTHVSFLRDSEARDKIGLFAPFFAPPCRVRIAASARIELAVYDATGVFTRWSTATWGPDPSSAPCEKPRDIPASGEYVRVARVTAGKYIGRDIHVDPALGVTVAAA